LHALDQIEEISDRAGNIIDQSKPMNHVNIDNFTSRDGTTRLTENILHEANFNTFNFYLKQIRYLENTQERLQFINDLYINSTRPIKLSSNQNYQALNMFNVFTCNLSQDNCTNPEFVKSVKTSVTDKIRSALLKLGESGYFYPSTLGI